MKRPKRTLGYTVGLVAIVSLFQTPLLLANAQVGVCNNTCICIYWQDGGQAWIDIRCIGDSGWSPTAQPAGSLPGDGTWGGGINPGTSTAPGVPLSTEMFSAVSRAKDYGAARVRGDLKTTEDAKSYYVANNCTKLFWGSKFSENGYDILKNYIVFRDGTGVPDPNDPSRIPCNEGRAAWTTCCEHKKYVMVCPAEFMKMTAADRATTLIHEAMHVAGQRESPSGNTGGTQPPSPAQIDAAIREACNLQ